MAGKKKAAGARADIEKILYEANELIRQSRELFAVSSDAAAGALSGLGDGRKSLSLEEAQDLIHQFMNRKVS
ncbi:hypothetical protein [Cohnella thailandensis]|uniref:YqzN/YkzM domain-containing protein n=1 Tax=Cohnella thailandensis TaxID=557557 RepID=A0A841SYT7_9BACL|nr:hypothetical protein [Cohnella thailandensis]MBB6637373.1 hypothetical protein [Cohnella thailandensis]MBP1976702.1 hypothetical protein [Cohnella thailandensis]